MESFDLQGQRMFPLALKHLKASSFADFKDYRPLVTQHKGAQFVVQKDSGLGWYHVYSDYWCGDRLMTSIAAVRKLIRSTMN